MPKTRRVLVPVLETLARDLTGTTLPTVEEVLACFVSTRENLRRDAATTKNPARLPVVLDVVRRTTAIWETAGLPVLSERTAQQMLEGSLQELHRLRDYPKAKRAEAYEKRKSEFILATQKLFDICVCKCTTTDCTCEGVVKASMCGRRLFLEDQRSSRSLLLQDAVSLGARASATGTPVRLCSRLKRLPSTASGSSGPSSTSPSPVKRRRLRNDAKDEDFSESGSGAVSTARNYVVLPNTASVATRYGVSDVAAAAIVSAFAVDSGLVTPSDNKLVVDPSKMRRQRTRVMSEANAAGLNECSRPISIYFDSRKNDTQVQEDLPGSGVKKTRHITVKQNHIVLLAEPGSQFIGHVAATGTLAVDEARAIISGLQQRQVSTDGIKAAGCDGTPYNTGQWEGVLACLERELGRPLQRVVCMLHFNELPLKRLMKVFDSPTSGPQSWTGPVGKLLQTAEAMPIKKFRKIDATLPTVDRDVLSWEQRYLIDACMALISGTFPEDLAARNPGELHQARWITTANRILRVYAAFSRPVPVLTHMAQFIVKVYAPCWFGIKREPNIVQGPHHLLQLIKLSRFLPKKMRDVVHESISINGFFAHPENILLSMAVDEQPTVRATALQRILDARNSGSDTTCNVRSFSVPNINFGAEDYTQLINWEQTPVTPPPLLSDVGDEELAAKITAGHLHVPALPCHTQAVERFVREITVAAEKVVGEERRDALVRTKLAERQAMPKFNTKAAFSTPKL